MSNHEVIEYTEEPTQDERVMAMLIYVLSLFTTIIAPLIIWLMKKDESEFINTHGKEYFNFFISYTIYTIVACLLMLILIGFLLVPILAVMWLVFSIIAAVKAYNGEYYVIPLTIRFIK